jgi:hypothetical protein
MIEYDCQSCAAEYQRELTYACATITSKAQRLTGVQREHEVPVIVTDKETLAQAKAPLPKRNFQHRVILPGLLRNYIKEARQFYLLLREHYADSLALIPTNVVLAVSVLTSFPKLTTTSVPWAPQCATTTSANIR